MQPRQFSFWLERHRRRLVAAYLVALGAVVAVVLVPGLRRVAANGVARIYDARQAHWVEEIDEAEAALEAGDAAHAAASLASLDAGFPARTNRHALDRERERILDLLGASEIALGHKSRALDAYRRAVAFDPLNIENHYALAHAALQLGEEEEAETHLLHAFEIYPSHAGVLRSLIELHFGRGDYAGVVELFEAYVEGFRVHAFLVRAGEETYIARLPIDGLTHEIRIGLDRPPSQEERQTTSIDLRIEPTYPTVEVTSVRWTGGAIAGEFETPAGRVETLNDSWLQSRADARATTLWMEARAGIPIDQTTWSRVKAAYRNVLRTTRIAEVRPKLDIVAPEIWDAARAEAP